jgi:ParB family chromosome partitioning protein
LSKRPLAKSKAPRAKAWLSQDKSLSANITDNGKAFTLALKAKDASGFGAYLTNNLEQLYRAFRESETVKKTGD